MNHHVREQDSGLATQALLTDGNGVDADPRLEVGLFRLDFRLVRDDGLLAESVDKGRPAGTGLT